MKRNEGRGTTKKPSFLRTGEIYFAWKGKGLGRTHYNLPNPGLLKLMTDLHKEGGCSRVDSIKTKLF